MVTKISETRIIRKIMVSKPSYGIKDPHLATINLATSEHLKLYNKGCFVLLENDR